MEGSNRSMAVEEVVTLHMVTDDDGSLKVKQVDEFRDSKAHFDFIAMTGITNE